MIVYSDSQFAVSYVKDLKYHGRTKHIDTKNNFYKDIISQKEVILKYLPTHEMVVDPFMKSIIRKNVFFTCKVIGIA